jgi:hypothetical protein
VFRNTDNWTDVEDRLKKLDRLTQEEAEMAAAQVLKATHIVDDTGRARGVADIALSVDNRVAAVGDMVAAVRDGAQYTFNQSSKNCLIPNMHRWRRGQDNYATNSRRCRSSEAFVIFEPHSCQTY